MSIVSPKLLGLGVVIAALAACTPSSPKLGVYRATLTLPGGELPVQMEIAREDQATVLYFVNGAERTRVTDVTIANGMITAKFPGIENHLKAKLRFNSLIGEVVFIRKGGTEQKLAFRAEYGKTYRFFEHSLSDNADVAGRWAVTFTSQSGNSYPAVAEFSQSHDQVTGTFLTTTGDHHFLAGQMRGDELYLSMFDGTHAFLYRARVDANGDLQGDYWSGSHSHERFTAQRNPDAALPEEATQARADSLAFTFPDLNGQPVSMSDERFRGKVVLVTLGGSWCGNCHDEAAFLAPFYREYRARGFEVIALMFERFGDFPRAAQAVERFRKHFNIEYTLLIAGISDTDEASAKLPQLSAVYAFPTAVLIDRHGKIRKIHSGFAGPATGSHHETYKREFTAAVEVLLGES